MNELFKTIHWRQHGWNFLLAALACVTLTVVILVHNNAQEALLVTQNEYQQQQSTNLEAEHSAAILAEFLPPYKELQQQGIIGQPQRLQWLETLRNNSELSPIPLVQFTLSPSTIATATDTTYASGTLKIKITPMQISFTLLHEGDFYLLMRAMETQSNGIFSAQDCNIMRNEGEVIGDTPQGSIDTNNPDSLDSFKGECDLVWYSLADLTSAWEQITQ